MIIGATFPWLHKPTPALRAVVRTALRWAACGVVLMAVGNGGLVFAAQDDHPFGLLDGPGSVIVVTVEGLGELEAWRRSEIPQSWTDATYTESGRWWGGTGLLGSNDPLRSIYGLLSGIPPLRIASSREPRLDMARQFLIPVTLAEAGRSVGARVEGFPNQWRTLRRMIPGVQPLVGFRRVLQELRETEQPFFYWLAMSHSRGLRGARLESQMYRILDTLEKKQALSRTLIVVTSVHDFDERVPLAIFFPKSGVACAGASCADVLAAPPVVPLEVVGSTLRTHLGYPKGGPALAPRWHAKAGQVISRRELREDGVLEGASVSRGKSTVSVRWQEGGMRHCWRRNHPACRWDWENPQGTTEIDGQLESALLLELEKILARRFDPPL